jgi:hypothetical protein
MMFPLSGGNKKGLNMFGKSWVTTVFGILTIALGASAQVITGPIGAALGLLASLTGGMIGIFAKDKNVTGGTVPATAEASARISAPGATASPPPAIIKP